MQVGKLNGKAAYLGGKPYYTCALDLQGFTRSAIGLGRGSQVVSRQVYIVPVCIPACLPGPPARVGFELPDNRSRYANTL